MLWEVAARYGFTRADLLGMRASELAFWHDGHRQMLELESQPKGK
jgi:hypothetical protein